MKAERSLDALLAADRELVNNYLTTVFSDSDMRQKPIIEAMNYSLSAGGKRLRASLLLQAYRSLAGAVDAALPFAAAVELIHCYSLIHDDLPAMDDDDLRRGKPTNHVVFGEAMAILAGDGLLNYAFELMLSSAADSDVPQRAIAAMAELAEGAGYRGMLGGQVTDILSENKPIDGATLDYIHRHKTAALIAAALTAGAKLGGADRQQVESYRNYGENLGMAFQIVDDILDVTGDAAQLGKPIGSDAQSRKNTYVSLHGLTKSRRMAQHYADAAARCLPTMNDQNLFFDKLNRALLSRAY